MDKPRVSAIIIHQWRTHTHTHIHANPSTKYTILISGSRTVPIPDTGISMCIVSHCFPFHTTSILCFAPWSTHIHLTGLSPLSLSCHVSATAVYLQRNSLASTWHEIDKTFIWCLARAWWAVMWEWKWRERAAVVERDKVMAIFTYIHTYIHIYTCNNMNKTN